MSMKEYELLRQKYVQSNESNYQKNNYHYDNNNYDNIYNSQNKNNRIETYDQSNNYKTNNMSQEHYSNSQMINNNIHSSKQINNIRLKHYDWGTEEKVMPDIINNNFNLRNINQSSFNNDNNGNKVLNENLFKRNTKKHHSIYGKYYSDKGLNNKINKEKARDINIFNNQIMQNKNWGNDNSYQVGRINFNSSIKKGEGINMRTRKKF